MTSLTCNLPRFLALILLGLALGLAACSEPSRPVGNLSGADIGGPFELVDETGRTVTSDTYAGRWRIMYFGFTWCPDVCPMDTAKLGAALSAFEESRPEAARDRLQPLFVTVDPERDTPAALAEFTANFHPRLVGLTGSRAQVDRALETFRVYASRVEGVTPGSYTYDHLAVFYLFDPEGRPVAFEAAPTATPESLVALLERYVR